MGDFKASALEVGGLRSFAEVDYLVGTRWRTKRVGSPGGYSRITEAVAAAAAIIHEHMAAGTLDQLIKG